VGIVDEDRRAVLFAHQLETALGAFELRERREGGRRLASGGNDQTGCQQGILDLEIADQGQAEPVVVARMHGVQRLRKSIDGILEEADAGALSAHGQQAQPTLLDA
jgi:hypothetical protein